MPKKSDSKIDAFLASLNKRLGGEKGRAVIQRGRDISWFSAARLSSGSLGLDIALNGGIPRGAVIQYMGEESSAKSTMTLKACAHVQQLYGDEAAIMWVAVEAFDKTWANQCGVAIPFTKGELALMSPKERKRWSNVKEVGQFARASAPSGEDALQVAEEAIRSGLFHIVAVDSVAALPTEAELEKDMTEHTMTQLPRLMGKFIKKCYAAFNTPLADGEMNQTAVILINQVRDKIGGYGHPAPEAPGGRSLKHALHANVRFMKGELYKTDDAEKIPYGRRVKLKVEKSKIGPPFREAEFDFYFEEHDDFHPGDIDGMQELRVWAIRAGLIEQVGNTRFQYHGKSFHGKASVEKFLAENPSVAMQLRRDVLRELTSADVD